MRYAVGPSLIALGVSIGSGEWLLGPAAIGAGGFRGIAVFAFLSIVFQAFYNIEIARYVTATGEVPTRGFATREELEAAGAKTYTLSPRCPGTETTATLDAIYADVRNIGKIFGVESRAPMRRQHRGPDPQLLLGARP